MLRATASISARVICPVRPLVCVCMCVCGFLCTVLNRQYVSMSEEDEGLREHDGLWDREYAQLAALHLLQTDSVAAMERVRTRIETLSIVGLSAPTACLGC